MYCMFLIWAKIQKITTKKEENKMNNEFTSVGRIRLHHFKSAEIMEEWYSNIHQVVSYKIEGGFLFVEISCLKGGPTKLYMWPPHVLAFVEITL